MMVTLSLISIFTCEDDWVLDTHCGVNTLSVIPKQKLNSVETNSCLHSQEQSANNGIIFIIIIKKKLSTNSFDICWGSQSY